MRVKGKIEKITRVKGTKTGSLNLAVQVDGVWYNYYTRNLEEIAKLARELKRDSEVELEYDETKGYKPIKWIRQAKPEEVQKTIKDDITGEPIALSELQKHLSVALDEIKHVQKKLKEVK